MSWLALQTALLTLVYLTVLGSLAPWDVLQGVAISLGIGLLVRSRTHTGGHPSAPDPAILLRFALFAGVIVWEIVTGSWAVLGVVLRLRPMRRPGIVAIPIESQSQTGLVVSALVVTIAPGTYLLDIDRERGVLVVHALDAHNPESIRAHFHRLYERYQRQVFP